MASKATQVTDLMAESLLPGRENRAQRMFNEAGLRAPELIWSPTDAELPGPLHRKFARMCRDLAVDGRVPESAVRLDDFGPLADWLMLMGVEDGGADFRYLGYGGSIAEVAGIDLTGQTTSVLEKDYQYLSVFLTGLYRAVAKTGSWAYSEHEPPRTVFVRRWQRLIVPLFSDGGEVTRILVLNVPDNELRAGLELIVDPVFVIGTDRQVIYANRAAQSLFGLPAVPERGATLETATGIPLDVHETAEELLSTRQVVESVQLVGKGSVMERLVMTVSAAPHRGQAFYVVVMRMIGA